MRDIYQKYLNNLEECHRLARANHFSPDEDSDAVLRQIADNATNSYRLRMENDAILNEILYSRRAEDLTEEDVRELSELADKMFTLISQNDLGTSYRIHQLLFAYAELKGDRDLRIRELYHLGVGLYFISPRMSELSINLGGKQATEYLLEGAKYIDRLEEIESEQTRIHVIRCFANTYLTDEAINAVHRPCEPFDRIDGYPAFKKRFDEIMAVLTSPRYHALVPNFNWDAAIHNLHFNRCLYYFYIQSHNCPDIVHDVLESAEYIYRHREKNYAQSIKEARIDYIYAATRWKAGLIDITELIEVLLESISHADKNDYSAHGITLNLQMPLYLEYTYKLMTPQQREPYSSEVLRIIRGVQRYLKDAPLNEYNNLITQIVGDTIRYRAQCHESQHKRMFDYLLFCHSPTYIHVRMCASLSRKLFVQMVESGSTALIGTFGITDMAEFLARKEELADRVYRCSLHHDIGKVMLLDYVGIYNRKLLNEEFAAIQLHSHVGAFLMQKYEEELSHVALHHHRFYDGSGGYPMDVPPCPPEYKVIADIASVSDSIEAATDNIGRCYSAAKSFDAIVSELRQGSGTRYAPYVVELFDDEIFYKKLESELHRERRETYLEVYRDNR